MGRANPKYAMGRRLIRRPKQTNEEPPRKKTLTALAAYDDSDDEEEEEPTSKPHPGTDDSVIQDTNALVPLGRLVQLIEAEVRERVRERNERRSAAGGVVESDNLFSLDAGQRARLVRATATDGLLRPIDSAAERVAGAVSALDLSNADVKKAAAVGIVLARFSDWYAGALADDYFVRFVCVKVFTSLRAGRQGPRGFRPPSKIE